MLQTMINSRGKYAFVMVPDGFRERYRDMEGISR